jgi:dihydrofolate reductase
VIISLIVAMDEKGGIGKNNQLPWHLPSDLMRFKNLTIGHHLVMGRKTYETIGKPLLNRVMIVVTHQKNYSPKGCILVNSLLAAIKLAKGKLEDELFIIGGGVIFKQAIGLADKIYLTTVHTDIDADVFFPAIDHHQWGIISREDSKKSETDEFVSDFKILSRKH